MENSTFYPLRSYYPWLKKTLLVMKLTFLITLAITLNLSAATLAQNITLSEKNSSIEKVLNKIEKQTGYTFFYKTNLIKKSWKVSVNVNEVSLSRVLELCFKDLPVTYNIVQNTIALNSKKADSKLVSAQQIALMEISGKVKDEQNAPLVGVTVKVKGTNVVTVTDKDGNFKIKVPDANAVLVFTSVGFISKEVQVGSNKEINVVLANDVSNLNEVVVSVGYGTQRKASLTAAVTSIKAEEIALIPTSNLSNVLAGRLSGTFVTTGTGTPGLGSSIRVRTQTSWNGGDAVYVIDGVVRDKASFDALDPNEVDDITILKDAASAAIYGSRSSNGVVLVTTKTGKNGKPVVEYSSVVSTSKPAVLPKFLSLKESLDLFTQIWGVSQASEDYALKANPTGLNFFNAAYRTPNNQKHSVSVSGGTDRVTYYLGGSYYDEKGWLPNLWFNKYNLRGNVQVKVSNDLTVGLNLNTNSGTRNRFNFTYDYGSGDLNNLWIKLYTLNAFAPPYIDGKPVNPGWLGNVVEIMKNGGYWRDNNVHTDALLNIDYKISAVPGLSIKGALSENYDNDFIKTFAQKTLLYNFKTTGPEGLIYTNQVLGTTYSGDPGTPYIGNENAKTNSYQLNGQINYDRTFGKSHISALAAYEQYEAQNYNSQTYRYNFPLFPTDQFFAASGNSSDWFANGGEGQDGRLSYIGRVNYAYDDKYLFSSSVRRDGSIKFAPTNRWGWFPSVSAGWVISKEDFFRNNDKLNFVDLLKLRFSYGSTGNDAIGGWQWQEQYNIVSSSFYFGNTSVPGLRYGGIPNKDLTWERSNSYNLGLDVEFLKKFTFTAEFYTRHTYDILGPRILALPPEFGGNLPSVNYGIVDGKGLEFELSYRDKIGSDFSYKLKGNFGIATNKVIKEDVAANAQPVDNPNGKPLGYLAGLVSTGVIKTQAQLSALPAGYTIYGATPELGMLNFQDVSGPNGAPDGKIDDYDRQVISKHNGVGAAPISFGLLMNLAYKRFSLDAQFAGFAGFTGTYSDIFGRNFGGGGLLPTYYGNQWSSTNANSNSPKLYQWGDPRATYTYTSTYNTYNASFVRLRYLNFAYDLPIPFLKSIGVKSARIFAQGTNLFVLSKFKFYDPEVNGSTSYPQTKTYSVGLNVKF